MATVINLRRSASLHVASINGLHIQIQKLLALYGESLAIGDILAKMTHYPLLGICIKHTASYPRRDEQ